jgi:hypothetical protein
MYIPQQCSLLTHYSILNLNTVQVFYFNIDKYVSKATELIERYLMLQDDNKNGVLLLFEGN